jgi:hypothetical protein
MIQERSKEVFDFFDLHRDMSSVDDHRGFDLLVRWLETASDSLKRRELLLTWLNNLGAGHSHRGGEFLSTPEVADFMARIGALDGGTSVLDPACGVGFLISAAAERLGAKIIHGIEINTRLTESARLVIPDDAEIFEGDAIHGSFPLADQYDLIICEPPFGARLQTQYQSNLCSSPVIDAGNAMVYMSVKKLSPHGRAVFLLPASCLLAIGKRMWRSLAENGFHLRALINVPSGLLKSSTVESYIAVIDRSPRDLLFTAQFGKDESIQNQIIKNFIAHSSGNRQAQGRLVNLQKFKGFKAMEAGERLIEYAGRSGLLPIPMKEMVVECQVLSSVNDPIEDNSNSIYIQLHGRCEAVLSLDGIQPKNIKILRLVLDGNVADARFVAASLNDEVGRLFLESVSRPYNFMMNLDKQALMDATFYLPTRRIQTQVLESRSKIHALRAELDEIDASLRSNPTRVDAQTQKLRKVNHKDSLEVWLESLPFPLASIMWRYRASNASLKEKNEILLHFFEAMAEFWATIYLSAAKSDDEFWADYVNSLNETIEKANQSYDRATFGLWKSIIEFFRKRFSQLLESEGDRCANMFGTASRDVFEMLFDARLVTVLQEANRIRNGKAHGGVLGRSGIQMTHECLTDLVQTCRSIMGTTWERYELIQPGECRYIAGVFNYSVKLIMGTRTPFASSDRKTIQGMEDCHLHLHDPEGDRVLKLLPFVRVMPSPRSETNACYFYNRRVSQNQKFISYHFEADSEIEELFTDTRDALDSLRPYGVI